MYKNCDNKAKNIISYLKRFISQFCYYFHNLNGDRFINNSSYLKKHIPPAFSNKKNCEIIQVIIFWFTLRSFRLADAPGCNYR